MYTVPKLKSYSAAALDKAVEKLLASVKHEAEAIRTEGEWKTFRDRWMGRKNGILTQINDLWLKPAPKDAKRDVGRRVNEIKAVVEQAVRHAQEIQLHLQSTVPSAKESADRLDITLPGIRRPLGAEHPVIKTMHEIVYVFRNLGYSVQEGPVIETDYYNFEALNFPPNHPARDTQDTLFIAGQESAARAVVAADPHFSGADSHHGEDEAADPHRDSGHGTPQRSAGREPLSHVPPGRRTGGGCEHQLL